MSDLLLKAADVGVGRFFKDEETGNTYMMCAHDANEGMCLAQAMDEGYWDCPMDRVVRLMPTPR